MERFFYTNHLPLLPCARIVMCEMIENDHLITYARGLLIWIISNGAACNVGLSVLSVA